MNIYLQCLETSIKWHKKPALYHQKGHLSIQFKLNLFLQNEKTYFFIFFNADRNNQTLKKSMKSLEIKYVLF